MSVSQETILRYKLIREIGRKLNSLLTKRLPKDVIDEGARKLGILHKGILVFDSEDEMAVLMDFCLYNVRRAGCNAVERLLQESPPPEGSDEREILHAMARAWYSLFLIEEVVPGQGVQGLDLLHDEGVFIVDISLSRSARMGDVIATRVIPFVDFAMTSGAGLPLIGKEMAEPFVEGLKKGIAVRVSPEEEAEFAAKVLRTCLRNGASAQVRYQDPEETEAMVARGSRKPSYSELAPVHKQAPVRSEARLGRNDPCRCGSGKKFKKCCGAHGERFFGG